MCIFFFGFFTDKHSIVFITLKMGVGKTFVGVTVKNPGSNWKRSGPADFWVIPTTLDTLVRWIETWGTTVQFNSGMILS